MLAEAPPIHEEAMEESNKTEAGRQRVKQLEFSNEQASSPPASDEVIESNQVKILQEALLEVIEQNEKLEAQNASLKIRLERALAESEAKDNAIAELAAALDLHTGGSI